MRSNVKGLNTAHCTRIKKSEDLVKTLGEESDALEGWQSTCHIYNSRIDEIDRALKNNARFRSSEKEKRLLLDDLKLRTLKCVQETEKLRKVSDVLIEKVEMSKKDMEKENELFSKLNESDHRRVLDHIYKRFDKTT